MTFGFEPIGGNYRVFDEEDNRVATCYLKDNAELVVDGLNAIAALHAERAMIYDFVGRDFAHLEPQDALLQHQASCLQEERVVSDKLLEALKDVLPVLEELRKEVKELHSWENLPYHYVAENARNTLAEIEALRKGEIKDDHRI